MDYISVWLDTEMYRSSFNELGSQNTEIQSKSVPFKRTHIALKESKENKCDMHNMFHGTYAKTLLYD